MPTYSINRMGFPESPVEGWRRCKFKWSNNRALSALASEFIPAPEMSAPLAGILL